MQHGENKEEKYEQRNYHTETSFNEYMFFDFLSRYGGRNQKFQSFNFLIP